MSSNVLMFAGSSRRDSVNKKLAELAAREIELAGGSTAAVSGT